MAEWIMVADDNQSVLKNAVRSWIEKGSGTQFDPVFAIIMPGIMDEDPDFTFRE